ncbi:deoxyribose-phosphate aldolase [Frigidibacter sp. MR17.14]|uniref:deoxyribose-phosphate aldolase n=1 Tax=Frigidibacter sp. MR17.14 TaxID=3126509 RepID=UPI003012B90D
MTDTTTIALIGAIDLTNLETGAPSEAIEALCVKANRFGTAAVCVYPEHVALARRLLEDSGVKVATVLNFPTGRASLQQVLDEAAHAVKLGAEELDLVVPYALPHPARATEAMVAAIKAAHPELPLKAILETGEMESDERRALARAAIAGGADFLKTSTGKTPHGASPEAAADLLAEIAAADRDLGLKVSGGIRDRAAALGYLAQARAAFGPENAGPDMFRIGCSGLLDALVGEAGAASGSY